MSDLSAAAVTLLRAGQTPAQVASTLAINRSQVYEFARAAGLRRDDWIKHRDKRILDLYAGGASLMEVASACGVSWATAQKVVASSGAPRPRGRIEYGPSETAQEILRRVQAGEMRADVARALGVSPQNVSRVMKRWGDGE